MSIEDLLLFFNKNVCQNLWYNAHLFCSRNCELWRPRLWPAALDNTSAVFIVFHVCCDMSSNLVNVKVNVQNLAMIKNSYR